MKSNQEAQINAGEYSSIWNVLSAIVQVDADLADIVKHVSAHQGESSGLHSKIDKYISVNSSAEGLANLISVKIIEKLAPIAPIAPIAKKVKNNSTIESTPYIHVWQVLTALIEQDTDLADIVKNVSRESGESEHNGFSQIEDYISINVGSKELEDYIKIKVLNQVRDEWEVRYGALLTYKAKHGTPLVNLKKDSSLYYWSKSQSADYHSKRLSPQRIELLNKIGFKWGKTQSIQEKEWWEKFEALKEFKDKTGNFSIPNKNKTITSQWPCLQRKYYKAGTLDQQKIEALNSIGFNWDYSFNVRIENFWNEQFEIYKEYLETGIKLPHTAYNWAYQIRKAHKADALPKDKYKRLEKIGFDFKTSITPLGKKHIQELAMFYKKNKHWNLQARVDGKKNNLYSYVWKVRQKYHLGKLSTEMITELNAINFDWGKNEI